MSSGRARDVGALRAALVALVARVSALEQQQPRRPTDLDLIAAIVMATRGRAFSALELHRHAWLVDHDLRALLQRAGAHTPIKLGKLLRRLSGVTGPYRLVRIGRDAEGVIWEGHVGNDDLHGLSSNSQGKSV